MSEDKKLGGYGVDDKGRGGVLKRKRAEGIRKIQKQGL